MTLKHLNTTSYKAVQLSNKLYFIEIGDIEVEKIIIVVSLACSEIQLDQYTDLTAFADLGWDCIHDNDA